MVYLVVVLVTVLATLVGAAYYQIIMNRRLFRKIMDCSLNEFTAFYVTEPILYIKHNTLDILVCINREKKSSYILYSQKYLWSDEYSKQILEKFSESCDYLITSAYTVTHLKEETQEEENKDDKSEKKSVQSLNIDDILDKISKSGKESLTEEEQNFLKNIR